MSASQFTDEQRHALGDCLAVLLAEVKFQREQKTGSVDILADDTEPATYTESTKADRQRDHTARRSFTQTEDLL